MKIAHIVPLTLLLFHLFFAPLSHGQIIGPLTSVNIGGVNMYCTSAQGQRVALFIDPSVNQYIGIASSNGFPTIRLGPGFFNSVPSSVGQFWFLHECAHHVVGANEAHSDCFAIKNMRNIGLITHPNQVHMLLTQISQMPGSNVHLPGPARSRNIYSCLMN
ncbi:hypothetical protein [uncultured Shewanella sp.]|uniref:hypothetical protein n=1 Tax=uncultured Shewanella sp. TaxID=173975 RepID=UPI002612932E|nr:hypothetical protein [uncultured Shewanella sp.]